MSTVVKVTVLPEDYEARLAKYNHEVELLEKQRKEFYEKNPDFWCKAMYINVCAPPMKFTLIEYE